MKVALQASPWNRRDLFETAGFETVEGTCGSEDDLIDLLRDADGAQVGIMPLTTRRVLEACPQLKVVSRMGVGVDSIDLSAATELGILVCNDPGVNTAEVADHAMALLLTMTRRLHDAIGDQLGAVVVPVHGAGGRMDGSRGDLLEPEDRHAGRPGWLRSDRI